MTNTLHIKNELKQLTRLYAFLDQQAGTYELGELQSMQIKLALEEAVTTGGLGIYLVKQLMTEVSYSRSAGKNILTMAKDIC